MLWFCSAGAPAGTTGNPGLHVIETPLSPDIIIAQYVIPNNFPSRSMHAVVYRTDALPVPQHWITAAVIMM